MVEVKMGVNNINKELNEIVIHPGSSLQRHYKMRKTGRDGLNITITIPREVVMRKARAANLTVDEFIRDYGVIAMYNSIDGVYYAFEETQKEGGE